MDPIKVIKDEQFLAATRAILGQARRSVDICTYKFEIAKGISARSLNSLTDLLYTLVVVGVQIRLLLNSTPGKGSLVQINKNSQKSLCAHGIKVRTLPNNRVQHAKVILVDRSMGIIGSHNWTPRAMEDNMEVSVVIYHAGYLQEIQNYFDKIWATAKKM